MNRLTTYLSVLVTALLIVTGCDYGGSDSESDETDLYAPAAVVPTVDSRSVLDQNEEVLAKKNAEITVGDDVSVWDSSVAEDAANGIFPIGGSGQVNGEFTIAERDGIQIALRAQERFAGTIPASGNKVGVYEAETGAPSGGNEATWNFDWHIDLRDSDYTLGDFDVTLHLTNITNTWFFDLKNPVDLTFGGLIPDHTVLYQSSQNPGFGNDVFDPLVEDTYSLRLRLKPTDGGAPLTVKIQVEAIDPS